MRPIERPDIVVRDALAADHGDIAAERPDQVIHVLDGLREDDEVPGVLVEPRDLRIGVGAGADQVPAAAVEERLARGVETLRMRDGDPDRMAAEALIGRRGDHGITCVPRIRQILEMLAGEFLQERVDVNLHGNSLRPTHLIGSALSG
ncbi:MAG: hypothetical protein SNJ79_06730, partial [Sphingomonadaceae bacterium]